MLYGKFDGTAVDYMGADYQFVRDQDILFVYSGERMQPDTIKMIRDQLLVKVSVSFVGARGVSKVSKASNNCRVIEADYEHEYLVVFSPFSLRLYRLSYELCEFA